MTRLPDRESTAHRAWSHRQLGEPGKSIVIRFNLFGGRQIAQLRNQYRSNFTARTKSWQRERIGANVLGLRGPSIKTMWSGVLHVLSKALSSRR